MISRASSLRRKPARIWGRAGSILVREVEHRSAMVCAVSRSRASSKPSRSSSTRSPVSRWKANPPHASRRNRTAGWRRSRMKRRSGRLMGFPTGRRCSWRRGKAWADPSWACPRCEPARDAANASWSWAFVHDLRHAIPRRSHSCWSSDFVMLSNDATDESSLDPSPSSSPSSRAP